MSSLSAECNELKLKYDNCFNQWYAEKYLKGILEDECQELFQKYKKCVWKHIRENNVDKLINDVVKDNLNE